MRTSVRVAAAAAAGLLFAVAGPALAAPSVSGLQSDYWWEGAVSNTALVAPPNVPAGGLWVASDPSGPSAVSAVRFTLEAGSSAPVLTLNVDSAQPSDPPVVACPTTSNWKDGPGPSTWSGRPTGDCSTGAVTGVYAPDGKTVSFDLSSLASPLGVDVVIQAAPFGISTPAESVTFYPVVAGDVSTTAPPTGETTPTTSPAEAVPLPSYVPPVTDYVPPVAAPGLGGTSEVATGSTPAVSIPYSASAPVPSTTATTSAPPRQPSSGNSSPAVLAGSQGRSWRDRILLGIAIFDIALYLLYQQRSPRPEAVAVGPVRTGKPPALR